MVYFCFNRINRLISQLLNGMILHVWLGLLEFSKRPVGFLWMFRKFSVEHISINLFMLFFLSSSSSLWPLRRPWMYSRMCTLTVPNRRRFTWFTQKSPHVGTLRPRNRSGTGVPMDMSDSHHYWMTGWLVGFVLAMGNGEQPWNLDAAEWLNHVESTFWMFKTYQIIILT